jgi:hypothetical protein
MRKPQKVVDLYLRGNIVMGELIDELGRFLAEGEASGFVRTLPKDILDEMVVRLNELPQTDEGWSRMRVLQPGAVILRNPRTNEEVEAEMREEVRVLRRGVELIRAAMVSREEGGQP